MAAPTFVAEYESVWNVVTEPASVSVTVATGDLLVVLAGTEHGGITLSTPTGGSLTYTLRQSVVNSTQQSTAYGWTAPSASGQTFSCQLATVGSSGLWGFNALRFSGSSGVGASIGNTGTATTGDISITTTAANSAVCVITLDWNASDGTSRTWRTINGTTPTSGNGLEVSYFRDASIYAIAAAYYPDVGAAGAKTVGLATPSGGKYATVAVEILGTAGGTNFTRTVDDSMGAADSTAIVSAFARTQTDLIGLSDTAATALAAARSQSDSMGLADSTTAALTIVRSVTDDMGLTDMGGPQTLDVAETITDLIGLTDSTSVVLTPTGTAFTRTVTDLIGLTDSVTTASVFARAQTDPFGPTDSTAAEVAYARTQTDSAGLTDSTVVQLAGVGTRTVDDSMGLTDSVTYSSTQTLTDLIGLTDSASVVLAALRSASDSMGLTDSVSVVLARSVTVTDSIGLTDSTAAQLNSSTAHVRTVTDSMGITSSHRVKCTTRRPNIGVTVRPNAGVTYRHPLIPD